MGEVRKIVEAEREMRDCPRCGNDLDGFWREVIEDLEVGEVRCPRCGEDLHGAFVGFMKAVLSKSDFGGK